MLEQFGLTIMRIRNLILTERELKAGLEEALNEMRFGEEWMGICGYFREVDQSGKYHTHV